MFTNMSVIVACMLMAFGWLVTMYAEEAVTARSSTVLSATGISMFMLGLLTGGLSLLGVV